MAVIVPAVLAVAGMAASASQQKKQAMASQAGATQGSVANSQNQMRDAAAAVGGTAGKATQGMNRAMPGKINTGDMDSTDRVLQRAIGGGGGSPSSSDAPAPGAGLRNDFTATRAVAGTNGLPNPTADNPALAGKSFSDMMGPKPEPGMDAVTDAFKQQNMVNQMGPGGAPNANSGGFNTAQAAGYAEQGAKLGMAMTPKPPPPGGIPNLGKAPEGIAGDIMRAMAGQRKPLGQF